MVLVIDASVALGWLLASQSNELTKAALDAIADSPGIVPPHFAVEVGQALRRQERAGLLLPHASDELAAALVALYLETDTAELIGLIPQISSLARLHRIRFSDAAYLEVALRRGAALATRDRGGGVSRRCRAVQAQLTCGFVRSASSPYPGATHRHPGIWCRNHVNWRLA